MNCGLRFLQKKKQKFEHATAANRYPTSGEEVGYLHVMGMNAIAYPPETAVVFAADCGAAIGLSTCVPLIFLRPLVSYVQRYRKMGDRYPPTTDSDRSLTTLPYNLSDILCSALHVIGFRWLV